MLIIIQVTHLNQKVQLTLNFKKNNITFSGYDTFPTNYYDDLSKPYNVSSSYPNGKKLKPFSFFDWYFSDKDKYHDIQSLVILGKCNNMSHLININILCYTASMVYFEDLTNNVNNILNYLNNVDNNCDVKIGYSYLNYKIRYLQPNVIFTKKKITSIKKELIYHYKYYVLLLIRHKRNNLNNDTNLNKVIYCDDLLRHIASFLW